MIAELLMKIAFWGGNAFWKTVEVALQKPRLLATSPQLTRNTRQLEILATSLYSILEGPQ